MSLVLNYIKRRANEMILGIDAGNDKTKVVTKDGVFSFHSAIGEFRERNLEQCFGSDDMIFEFEGKKGFAGTLALYESEFVGSRKGESKAHEEAKLRILLAIHRFSDEEVNDIIVGQPISTHNKLEKDEIKNMLQGEHVLKVDYGKGFVKKKFYIRHVNVAAECACVYLTQPKEGLIRIIDIGSGTINCATVRDLMFIDKDSFTIPFGLETVKNKDYEAIARAIVNQTLNKWSLDDNVWLVGGGANVLFDELKRYFKNIRIHYASFKGEKYDPIFSNAIAFYQIGLMLYEG
jgi:plasmid segregation protein ParM